MFIKFHCDYHAFNKRYSKGLFYDLDPKLAEVFVYQRVATPLTTDPSVDRKFAEFICRGAEKSPKSSRNTTINPPETDCTRS